MSTAATQQDLPQVLGPADTGYDDARAVWNAMFDRRPREIWRCRDAADVAAAIERARAQDVEIGVRCGGHSMAGHSTGDGALLIDDAIVSLDWLFRGGPEPRCADAADSNDDGLIDLTDAVYTLSHLFQGGPSPPPPHPGKGRDPTADSLDCRG